MMTTAILKSTGTLHAGNNRLPGLMTLVKNLTRLSHLRNQSKPEWAHVSDRVWRRNSALLTYLHEAQSDEG